MKRIRIERIFGIDRWLVMDADAHAVVPTHAAAIRLVDCIARAGRFAMAHGTVTITADADDLRRVLELADHGLEHAEAVIADAADRPTEHSARHRAALERIRDAHQTAILAL